MAIPYDPSAARPPHDPLEDSGTLPLRPAPADFPGNQAPTEIESLQDATLGAPRPESMPEPTPAALEPAERFEIEPEAEDASAPSAAFPLAVLSLDRVTPDRVTPASAAGVPDAGLTAECEPGSWRRALLGLLPALAALILLRALLLHGDPSDFAQDRNFTMAMDFEARIKRFPLDQGFWPQVREFIDVPAWIPEFPFVGLAAWLASPWIPNVVLAGRLFSLAAAILTGLGLWILGRRLGPPGTGPLALWLYALAPLSVFMGRNMLPDAFMGAALTWALVAAGAGRRWVGWRQPLLTAVALTAALSIAGLAKLPAVMFAPVAALAWMEAVGWRRPLAWLGLAAVAAGSWLAVCGWYDIAPLAPLGGMQRISRGTNNLIVPLPQMLSSDFYRIWLSRMVLALTAPGLATLVLGWVMLGGRRRDRLWLTAWLALSLAFVWVTARANAYWAYAALPCGVVTAALGIAELTRRARAAGLMLAALAAVALLFDPGVRQVGQFLAVMPNYRAIAAAPDALFHGWQLYQGLTPGDLKFITKRNGVSLSPDNRQQLIPKVAQSSFGNYLDISLRRDDAARALWPLRPIARHQPHEFLLFDTTDATGLGDAVAAPPPAARALPLKDELTLLHAALRPADNAALDLELVWQRGASGPATPWAALWLVHDATSTSLPLVPLTHGAQFVDFPMPMVQLPDFKQGPIERMVYRLRRGPWDLSAGRYAVRFALLEDSWEVRPRASATTPYLLTVPATRQAAADPAGDLASAPLRIDPNRILWQNAIWLPSPSWRGRIRQSSLLQHNQAWFAPHLPAGDYEVRITGRGRPAGGGAAERWPRLSVRALAGGEPAAVLTFDSTFRRTRVARLRLAGPTELIHLRLENPGTFRTEDARFALDYDDLVSGQRGLVIDGIELRPAMK